MASEIADVPAPFSTKLTPEQSVEYRKRKVALISGTCLLSHPRDPLARLCLIVEQVLLGRMVRICEYSLPLFPIPSPSARTPARATAFGHMFPLCCAGAGQFPSVAATRQNARHPFLEVGSMPCSVLPQEPQRSIGLLPYALPTREGQEEAVSRQDASRKRVVPREAYSKGPARSGFSRGDRVHVCMRLVSDVYAGV